MLREFQGQQRSFTDISAWMATGSPWKMSTERFASRPPVTLMATVVVLIIVALVAGLFPAMRAASVDPMHALRAE